VNDSATSSLNRLREIIRRLQSVLVAYSGGVDSALVMAVASEQLGQRALACIGVSPSYPGREQRAAIRTLKTIGASYRLVEPHEQTMSGYVANADDRCYFCKSALFGELRQIAASEGWNAIVDGTHLDDVGDHRHGMQAAAERGVVSPLLEAKLSKLQVRLLARRLGLEVWDKPAMACLASRVPHGTAITPALLEQIEAAEDVLADLGFDQFRVRHHGETARIEVPVEQLMQILQRRELILTGIRDCGYRHVTIDLAGFRGGAQAQAQNTSQVVPLLIHGSSASHVPAAHDQNT
jgi:uncharacterized protein